MPASKTAKTKKTDKTDKNKKAVKAKVSKSKAVKSKVKEPQTMEELLAQVGKDNLRIFRRGEKIEGVVTLVSKRVILVDVGAKTEGVIPEKEVKLAKDFIKDLQVGDRIEAYVARNEDDKGQLLLSIRKTVIEHKWKKMKEYFETGESFDVLGTELVKGGLLVDALGLQGFIPASQFSAKWAGKYHELIGKSVPVKVIEVNPEINRLVLSEKLVTEAPLEEKKRKVLEDLDISAVYEGIITGTVPFGAFVKVKVREGKTEEESVYLDGLIHISEIAWEKVDNVNDYVKVGQKV
ncbi:MAG: 30S ribosomal protein S1, partial [bacterium]|nr:30S ribosomal protein S1 [bacterium]